MNNKKVGVIYTCITGGYDELRNHTYINSDWDYVCFTDNLSIKNSDNSVWQIKSLVFKKLDNVRNQRWHKLHPHILFPEYQKSIWIDANIDVLKKDLFNDVQINIDEHDKISIVPHPIRDCIYEEFSACIDLKKDDPEIMKKQADLIKKEGFPKKQGLFDTSIIYRKHRDSKVIEIMEDWWWWIENYSRRDQLSLTFVLWKHGFKVLPLASLTYRENDGRLIFLGHNTDLRKQTCNLNRQVQWSAQGLPNFSQIIQEKDREIGFMKSSKFWRVRGIYIKYKSKLLFLILSPNKFIKKYFRRKNKKLVMTLLIRDEADIIKHNIDFHLAHGVDFIIATDNGSIDGTRDILKEYEKKGVLFLIDEKEKNHSQSQWVNRMGKIAFEKYKADIIFHCDADEFWYPKKGNLKTEIWNSSKDVLYVDIMHVLLEYDRGLESFPEHARWLVINPIETENLKEDSKKEIFYFFRNPSKVMFKTNKTFFNVGEGNHEIENVVLDKKEFSENVMIYHFPLRNKNHFFNKVKNGGSALSDNKSLSEEVGWHWRRWYESYLNGKLEDEYKKLIITKEKADELLKKGMIEKFDFKKFIN